MATKKPKSQERQALDAFDKKHEGKELTEAQEREREKLDTAMRSADFIKLASRKANTVVRQLGQLSKMVSGSRYVYTPKQADALKNAFKDALNGLASALDGKAVGEKGVDLNV